MDRVVSLADVSSYLPENRVGLDYFAQFADTEAMSSHLMFKAPPFRHHVAPDETPADMAERAMAPLLARHGSALPREVDILVTHTQLVDPVIGGGGDVAHRLGVRPEWLIDLHNGGCASFIHAMKIARHLLQTTEARSALVVSIQNMAGAFFRQEQVRVLPQAPIPGDGAGIGYLTASTASPILDIEARHLPEHTGRMTLVADPPRQPWQSGSGQLRIGFTESGVAEVLERGNRIVPEAARRVLTRLGLTSEDVDLFVTNQPNRAFLRNWRDALSIPPERHPDTFDECGNLFGAGMPVTLDRAISEGAVAEGALVLLAGFAHAGDFAAAAALRWGGR